MTSSNGLICFTNCLLPLEDGSLVEKDLWVDERRGVILDAQKSFFVRNERPARTIDLGGNILSPGLIDIQINGAYGFDFSVYDGDDAAYRDGLKLVAERIVETGVTALVPTLITQDRSYYPKLLNLLRPFSTPTSAHLLGWHAEGPFLQFEKRGAHYPQFLLSSCRGIETFEEVYGTENLCEEEDWLMANPGESDQVGVRILTAAPELEGVLGAVGELTQRGIVYSIGHSIATTDIATAAMAHGARLITHLFNAMPQLHHRDPSIIGLLGSSPHLSTYVSPTLKPVSTSPSRQSGLSLSELNPGLEPTSEAFDELETPPQTPLLAATLGKAHTKATLATLDRPFYELIVDGIHSHPNSVRLAYNAYPDGCILITDAMKILDPNLRDGTHEWRDGKRLVKEGYKLYLEGTTTLAGSVVTLDTCVRNFAKFTGCSLGQAIMCATYNPARCIGIEDRKGTLRAGADADLIVLDKDGIVLKTWVKGKEVWSRT